MGLICNGDRRTFSPFRVSGGSVATIYNGATHAGNFSKTGWLRGIAYLTGSFLTALPSGHRHPQSWMMPQKPGAISSRNAAFASLSGAAAGALGKNAVAEATFALTGLAVGQLVVSGVANATLSLSASGNVIASLAAVGNATLSVFGSGSASALAWAAGNATATLTGNLVRYAVGHMQGDVVPYTELSPQSLASAVWEKAIEAGYTAEQILRGLAAVGMGPATGLDGSNPQFTGLDGTTTRVDGALSGGTRTIDSLDLD